PPIGRACRKNPPLPNVFSDSTQMSIGSLSPSMPLRPVRNAHNSPTSTPQYVCGTNPYSVGDIDEKRCGRSTRRWPDHLSSSYLTASGGTISMYALTSSG